MAVNPPRLKTAGAVAGSLVALWGLLSLPGAVPPVVPAPPPGLRAALRTPARGDQVAVASLGRRKRPRARAPVPLPLWVPRRRGRGDAPTSRQRPLPPGGPRRALGHAGGERARGGDP